MMTSEGETETRLNTEFEMIEELVEKQKLKEQQRRDLIISVIYGQFLAFVVAISALINKMLVDYQNVSSPAMQNVWGYGMTCLVFLIPCGLCKRGLRDLFSHRSIIGGLFLVSIADSQASFIDNLAYRYNVSIASVGMLASFTIPCVMVLSYCFLKVRYKFKHFLGTFIGFLGLVCVISADIIMSGNPSNGDTAGNGSTSVNGSDTVSTLGPEVIGDILILFGSGIYAISNVASEAFVKSRNMFEYLVWMGFFGCMISLLQFGLTETNAYDGANDMNMVFALFFFFGVVFAFMYAAIANYLRMYDSVVFNLSLLTTDVWGIVFGYFFFSEEIHILKLIGFAAVVAGVVLYNMDQPIRPVPTLVTPPSGSVEDFDAVRLTESVQQSDDRDDDDEARVHMIQGS